MNSALAWSTGLLVTALYPVAQQPVAAERAQEPILHASEVTALRFARSWQQARRSGAESPAASVPGWDVHFFGYDPEGKPGHGRDDKFARTFASVVVLSPTRGALVPSRRLMANSLGHVFLAEPAENPAWHATMGSVIARDVDDHLNNMLLQSGTARDGTLWLRIEALAGDIEREQRVVITRADGASSRGYTVEISHPRFPWHPAWLPVDPAVVSVGRLTTDREGAANGSGLVARGLAVNVSKAGTCAVLRPEDVRLHDGQLLITLSADCMVPDEHLDDQAWGAEALRQLVEFQLAAQKARTIDRDGDGHGEFGQPDEVVPIGLRRYRRIANGRFLLQNHLFEVHVPNDPDAAEKHFVAYSWPATAVSPHDFAFAVDERGIVLRCAAHGRFAGHDKAPAREALADATLWQPLR